MYLYSLTLQKAGAVYNAVTGNFSAPRIQEIVVSRGKILELLRHGDDRKLHSIHSTEIFGVIRSLMPVRLVGSNQDYLLIGSDSGRITILEFDDEKRDWKKVHLETFGKSGCRRVIPGQYIAADPKGRAFMIGAVEKQKLVYILNRDSGANLTISSPLEAHKSHSVVYSIVGYDTGFENPLFAALELNYADADFDHTGEAAKAAKKTLTLYELELGQNHVVKKASIPVDRNANELITVPGPAEGPGGIIVVSEGSIAYKAVDYELDLSVPIPKREGMPEGKNILIVSSVAVKQRKFFFFLLQSELGDLYKVWLDVEDGVASDMHIKYFDTVPVSSALCVTKNGFLYIPAEFGDHRYYHFIGIGVDDEPHFSASSMSSMSDETPNMFFRPRALKNLELVDGGETASLAPIIDMEIGDYADEITPQVYTLCGRGPRSSLRCLRHGLSVSEMAVSGLPGTPSAVWTVKKSASDEHDSYIILSFTDATLVLEVGESVEEVSEEQCGLVCSVPTIGVGLVGEESLVQVHASGIRLVTQGQISEWKSPAGSAIVKCTMNDRQVAVALDGGEIVYFECDVASGQLQEIIRKNIGHDITAMDLGDVPVGRLRFKFLAVAAQDRTVRVFSVDPESVLESIAVQAIPAIAESLCMITMTEANTDTVTSSSHPHSQSEASSGMFLNAGLSNGLLLRTVMDPQNGSLSDTRTRLVGSISTKLCKVALGGGGGGSSADNAVLALSSRSWLLYTLHSKFSMLPLSYTPLSHAAGFNSDQCPNGVVAVSERTLRIFSFEQLGDLFNQVSVALPLTPRRMLYWPSTNQFIVIGADHNAFSSVEKETLIQAQEKEKEKGKEESQSDTLTLLTHKLSMDDARWMLEQKKAYEESDLTEAECGAIRPSLPNKWASELRIVDPVELKTIDMLVLTDNEAAFSIASVQFEGQSEEYVVVGTAKDYNMETRECTAAYIHCYRLHQQDGRSQLEFINKTQVESVVLAMAAIQGKLVAGVGSLLRVYSLGKKQLVRKSELRCIPTPICRIHVEGSRIIVGDVAESFHFVKYTKNNQLFVFADSTEPRWLTSSCVLDYNTMAGSDKFGNVFIARFPPDTPVTELQPPPSIGPYGRTEQPSTKLQVLCNYHVGEMVTSLKRCTLVAGGEEVILYSTVQGSIGALVPITSREDIDFFTHLEMHLRQEKPPLCGRDHVAYRSAFFPVKNVIDGDLSEMFGLLNIATQRTIADELERSVAEVHKKLEDIRNRVL